MNAIDTNVLARIVVEDDEIQARRALNYIQRKHEVFVSLIVLCEFTWVLTDCYEIKKEKLISVIEAILKTNQFIVEDSDIAWAALQSYKRNSLDFADCLIGTLANHRGCEVTGTFDKKAAKCDLFELV